MDIKQATKGGGCARGETTDTTHRARTFLKVHQTETMLIAHLKMRPLDGNFPLETPDNWNDFQKKL